MKLNQLSNNKYLNKILHMFCVLALFGALSSCQNTTKNNKSEEYQIEQKEREKKQTTNREYIIYKKQINSIVGVKSHLTKAQEKVDKYQVLSNILSSDDMSISTLLPKILKESAMDNTRTSISGAQWYMQLTQIAIDEIYRIYPNTKDINLNPTEPVDNIILWALYRKLTHKDMSSVLQENKINFSENEIELLMILSYNIGPSRTKNFIKQYKPSTFENFIVTMIKKNSLPYNPTEAYDNIYKVHYINMFGDKEFSSESTREKNKIKEGVRYVYIIDALIKELQSDLQLETIKNITITPQQTLYSQVKELRDQWIFINNANINDICKIILESNGFSASELPNGETLIVIKEAVINFIPK